MSRSGADLARSCSEASAHSWTAATAELARRGYEDVRHVHDFAMRAIAAGAGNASELGCRLSVTRQAATKTIAVLQERGYETREHRPPPRPPHALSGQPARLRGTAPRRKRPSTSCAISGSGRSDPPGSRALRCTWQSWSAISPCTSRQPAGCRDTGEPIEDELARPASVVSGDEGSPCLARSAQAMTRPVRILPGRAPPAGRTTGPAQQTGPFPAQVTWVASSRSNAPASDTPAPRPSADTVILGWRTVFFTRKVSSPRRRQDLPQTLSSQAKVF